MTAALVYSIKTETVVSMEKSLITKTLDHEKSSALGKQYEAIFGKDAPITSNPEPSLQQDEWNTFKKEVEQQYQERKATQLNAIDAAYQREKKIQQTIAANISFISPSAAFAHFVTDLCGTGESDKIKYLEAVNAHQQSLDVELFSQAKRTTVVFPGGRTASTMSIEKNVDLKALPTFHINETGLPEILGRNLGSLISLAFWLIAPFAVAYVQFLKYDVR